MAKVQKRGPTFSGQGKQGGRKSALVFCGSLSVGRQIVQQLEKRSFRVRRVEEANTLLRALDEMDPDLILLDVAVPVNRPWVDIVAELFAWNRRRARAINKLLESPSQTLWEHAKVVMFKSEEEISPTGSLTADIADTDELVRLCSLVGPIFYAGIYFPFSFMSKLRPYVE